MKSCLPKVLHSVGGKPLLGHVLAAARRLNPIRVAEVVIGHGAGAVRQAYPDNDIRWVIQEQQLGTGHAVLCARDIFHDFGGDVLILSGDVPLIKASTLQSMLEFHRREQAAVTLLTATLADPAGYGRILRTSDGAAVARIVEEKDATAEQRRIGEVNAGIYVVSAEFLFAALTKVKNDNQQGEYYLPDIITIGLEGSKPIRTVWLEDAREMMGVNTRQELAFMEKNLRDDINRKWLGAGVTLRDPDTTYIDADVTIGRDTVVGPNASKGKDDDRRALPDRRQRFPDGYGNWRRRCAEIFRGVDRQPHRSRRDHWTIRPSATGNSFRLQCSHRQLCRSKGSQIGDGTKANHFTYLGDVTIGRDTQHRRRHDHVQLRRVSKIPDDHRRPGAGRQRYHVGRANRLGR